MSSFSRRPTSNLASGVRSRTLPSPTRTPADAGRTGGASRLPDRVCRSGGGARGGAETSGPAASGHPRGGIVWGARRTTTHSSASVSSARRRVGRHECPRHSGNLRSALAVTRSLGRQGVAVTVADERRRSLAGVSRYCRDAIQVPSAARSPEAFLHAIHQVVERGKHRVAHSHRRHRAVADHRTRGRDSRGSPSCRFPAPRSCSSPTTRVG